MPVLVGIAGGTASGKTVAAKAVAKEHRAYHDRYSNILAEIANEKGIPLDKPSLQRLSTEMRADKGEDVLNKLMEGRIVEKNSECTVVEGIRRVVDVESLISFAEEHDYELFFIYIDASPDIRFERFNARLESAEEEPVTRAEFDEMEADECEKELPKVRGMIEEIGHIVDNGALTVEALEDRVLEIIE